MTNIQWQTNIQYPPYQHEVIVYCRGFQCLGIYAQGDQWRFASNRELIQGVEGWSFLDRDEIHPVSDAKKRSEEVKTKLGHYHAVIQPF